MPSSRNDRHRNNRPDFVIGDRYGTSSAAEFVHFATQILRSLGYQVAINKPYAGGFITEHYGRPKDSIHAIQVEINRSLYMNEGAMMPNDNYDRVCSDLAEFVDRLVISCGEQPENRHSLAAE